LFPPSSYNLLQNKKEEKWIEQFLAP